MNFDQLLRRWPISMGWYFDKDENAGGDPGNSTQDGDGKKKPDESNAGDDPTKAKEDKIYSKAEMEAIVKDRLKNSEKKAEAAAEKARKDAEAAALEKNQEWQKLAETRAAEIAALAQERDDLVAFKEQAERYKKALDDQLAKVKEKLPKHLLPLIDKLDPVEAMAYITEHAEELGAKPSTYDETPKGKERKLNDEDKKEAQKASGTLITRTF